MTTHNSVGVIGRIPKLEYPYRIIYSSYYTVNMVADL